MIIKKVEMSFGRGLHSENLPALTPMHLFITGEPVQRQLKVHGERGAN